VRCTHGFEREVVPCPTCDGGKTKEPRAWAPSTRRAYRAATHARRNQAEPHNLVGEYQCSSCGRTKPLSEFYISRSHSMGHQSRCKTCDNNKRVQRLQRARVPYAG
jgi:hypothetical protein